MNYDELRRELTEEVGPEEAEALLGVAETLYAKRPVPRAAFRGDLRRLLVSSTAPRPAPAQGAQDSSSQPRRILAPARRRSRP